MRNTFGKERERKRKRERERERKRERECKDILGWHCFKVFKKKLICWKIMDLRG